jgi:hypothetical protein
MSTNTQDFVPYVGEFEFAEDSQWGHVVLQLAEVTGDYRILKDPEAIRCHETGRVGPGKCIRLGSRMFTDDNLGKLDGPGRYIRKPDPTCIKALTPLSSLSKKQRRKVRKLRRSSIRAGAELTTVELIEIVLT